MAGDPGKVMAPPTHASYLAQMLQDGKISQFDHDALNARHTQELQNTVTNHSQNRISINIAGNITISDSLNVPGLHAASRVFNTAELLELILEELPAEQLLLQGSLICKGFQTAIDNTPRFQRRLFRAPDYPQDRAAVTDWVCIDGLDVNTSCTSNNTDIMKFDGVEVRIDWMGTRKFRLKFDHSTTLEHLHITQPPTKHLIVNWFRQSHRFVTCTREMDMKIYAEDGITVGHLMDWARNEFRPRFKDVKDVYLAGYAR
ncbi:hypothetical protein LTR37_002606 [Vermiconidia calcicola]|uniref:Uncharacterized protein n=1 Tax=Vermiconidia calcicola TaxID=1690605 RepID=A0ACC3NSH5_9PEZI|nr:hypothetical protein LTR37_002606 [Vermiconidia calcicola]